MNIVLTLLPREWDPKYVTEVDGMLEEKER
jgi:hypothetical protein